MRFVLLATALVVASAAGQLCGVCPDAGAIDFDACRVRGTTCAGGADAACSNAGACTTDADCSGLGDCDGTHCLDPDGVAVSWLPCSTMGADAACDVCFHRLANGTVRGGTCTDDVASTPCTIAAECTTCACVTSAAYLETCAPAPPTPAPPAPTPAPIDCALCAELVSATATLVDAVCASESTTNVTLNVTCADVRDAGCGLIDILASFTFSDGAPVAPLAVHAPGGETCEASGDLVECALSSDAAAAHTFALVVTLDTTDANVTLAVDKIDAGGNRCQNVTGQPSALVVPACTETPAPPTPAPTPSCAECTSLVTAAAEITSATCVETGTLVGATVTCTDTRSDTCSAIDVFVTFFFYVDGTLVEALNVTAPGGEPCFIDGVLVQCLLASDAATEHTFALLTTLDATTIGANVTMAVAKIELAPNLNELCQTLTPQTTSFALVPACVDPCDVCSFSTPLLIDPDYVCTPTGLRITPGFDTDDTRALECGPSNVTAFISLLAPFESNVSTPLVNVTQGGCSLRNSTTAACPINVPTGGALASFGGTFFVGFVDPAPYIVATSIVDEATGHVCSSLTALPIPGVAPYCPRPACEECANTTMLGDVSAYTRCANASVAFTHVRFAYADLRESACDTAPRQLVASVNATLLNDVSVFLDGAQVSVCTTLRVDGAVQCSLGSIDANSTHDLELTFVTAASPTALAFDASLSDQIGRACPAAGIALEIERPTCTRPTMLVPPALAPYARVRCRRVANAPATAPCGDGDEPACEAPTAACLAANCCKYIEVPP